MLPAVAPAVSRRARAGERLRTLPIFIGSYLAVWLLVGCAIHALFSTRSTFVAGAVAIAAGAYEITPLKRYFRQLCARDVRSGFTFAFYCAGSCIGLMLMQAAFGMMSMAWMVAIAAVVLGQKLIPPNSAIDVPLGLAMVAIGSVLVVAPLSILGLIPPMCGG